MTVGIRPFDRSDTEQVVALWREAGLSRPWNDPHRDIERKLEVQPELFVVAVDGEQVVGTVMAGYDGHRGWLHYLATAEDRRGEGIGRLLVSHAEQTLLALGCPKVQLLVRPGNDEATRFYWGIDYEEFATAAFGKRLIADGSSGEPGS